MHPLFRTVRLEQSAWGLFVFGPADTDHIRHISPSSNLHSAYRLPTLRYTNSDNHVTLRRLEPYSRALSNHNTMDKHTHHE